MQKTHQPNPTDKMPEWEVQPLTEEEIGQISGGQGQSRTGVLVPKSSGPLANGRSVYFSR